MCSRLDILPVEIVVRDYLAGTTATSVWSMYKAGRREIYGLRFPDGLRENEKLPQTVITPTTKARDGEHDEPITPAEIVERGLLSAGAVATRSRRRRWRCSPEGARSRPSAG